MIIVKKFDSNGKDLGLASRPEAIIAVMRQDPKQVSTILSEFGFSRCSDIPFKEKERLEGLAQRDFPAMIQSGVVFQVDTLEKFKKPSVKNTSLETKIQKRDTVQIQKWVKSKDWKVSQLLEIFGFLADSRRFEVRYSFDRFANEKSSTGAVRFQADLSEQPNLTSTKFLLFVDDKQVALLDQLSSISLTKLD